MPSTLDRFQSIDPALLDIGPDDRVIDLGCGTGRHVLELSKIESNIIGADMSRNDIRAGRYLLEIMRRRDEVKARVHWLQTAGERLPFRDAAFDRVICTETLEHVDDDSVLARELSRVLKPGGILAVSVPDEFSEKIFWKLSTNYRTHVGGHVRIYRRGDIVRLLRDAGLEPYAVRYRHALETAYWLSHIAFWSDWGKQGPITKRFRELLDSPRARASKIVTAIDDIGNRMLPKSIVVYSRKPLLTEAEVFDEDDRSAVEVRAVPAPFEIAPPVPKMDAEPPALALSLGDELRLAIKLEGEEQKRRLIEIVRSCRFSLMREVQDLDGEQASAPWTKDGRSMKEIVGHITGWERWTTAAIEEIIRGTHEPSIMSLSGYPIGISRYGSIDAFNAARMGEARERPWAEILEESDRVFDAMIAAAERATAEQLAGTAQFLWPDIGGTVPCGMYLLMVCAHHYQAEHLPEVAPRPSS
jgi:ubiquinone/menaquinone biosynthesis C-methylase UbiE